ncbi:MAG: hypothetical protein HY729_06305 [Candidatus Rokubacteria bacterium]|nr:hypothetical protein [Candidatus Rokubacteria bacterium]
MNDFDVAIAVADEGAAVVRRCFGTTLQRLDKGAGDFATNADIEAENAMLALLHRERPEDAILGSDIVRGKASHRPAADRLQRPLVPRSRFQRRLRPSVRFHGSCP